MQNLGTWNILSDWVTLPYYGCRLGGNQTCTACFITLNHEVYKCETFQRVVFNLMTKNGSR